MIYRYSSISSRMFIGDPIYPKKDQSSESLSNEVHANLHKWFLVFSLTTNLDRNLLINYITFYLIESLKMLHHVYNKALYFIVNFQWILLIIKILEIYMNIHIYVSLLGDEFDRNLDISTSETARKYSLRPDWQTCVRQADTPITQYRLSSGT